ncbi:MULTISPECIES: hypothetical protein [Dactylosporangium]|uniref:Uncharacterized protein n=2 Tax=Dactylosporangium TaxID=35753 RepID=A0A9W6KXF7_9ACTN|nr:MULTISPECIES: hypothetical protein [Dactylosporangium]UAB95361.1 hypothetical protein Dvina_46305 [Dactylosporangium vinaceum]UWZ43685.1 hypothetical protein Dmats_40655 [Dactylosporangium matsuzakiense]GLL08180.1 hypothetical protein GCM10017581_099400 [Dactylosporangium matsuzakiense]
MPAIDDCLHRAMSIKGALGASLIDYTTGQTLGLEGGQEHIAPHADPTAAALGTASVIHAAMQTAAYAPAIPGDTVEDVIISTSAAYHLIRPVRTSFDSRLVLYVWLDRNEGNLAIARRRVRSLADDLA